MIHMLVLIVTFLTKIDCMHVNLVTEVIFDPLQLWEDSL